jgi:hypothetical protein
MDLFVLALFDASAPRSCVGMGTSRPADII